MQNTGRLLIILLAVVQSLSVCGQDIFAGYEHLFVPPLRYVAYQATATLTMDGKLTEDDWTKAPWSDNFSDIEGNKKPDPALRTRMKMLWDKDYLYIAAELEEPGVWAKLKNHDDIIYNDNDFEVFIDPDGDTYNYYEIEVNAFNTIFDLMLPKPYRDGGPPIITWDAKQLKSAVQVYGTINDAGDNDEKWVVEMAIPFSALSVGIGTQVPNDKDIWRINFSRVQWDTEVVSGIYTKITDPVTKRSLPEHNWVWSPQGVINMHLPERWGYLHFSTEKPATPTDMDLPASEALKKYLWLLYYKQREYREKHHTYASRLSQLNMPATVQENGVQVSLTLTSSGKQYTAVVKLAKGAGSWQITHDGKLDRLD